MAKDREARIGSIIEYCKQYRGMHILYAIRFFSCECLNFINILGQIFFLISFLGHDFTTYGTDILQHYGMDQIDRRPHPMDLLFPKVG